MQTAVEECHRPLTSDGDTTSDRPCQLCRFCAQSNSCMMPIFRGQRLTDDLPSKIKAYMPVETVAEEKDDQQIIEGRTSILKVDNVALSSVELTSGNQAVATPETVSNERCNSNPPDKSTFQMSGKKVKSDAFKKSAAVENQKTNVLKDNMCFRSLKKNHFNSHIMQKSSHYRIETTCGVITETNSDFESQLNTGTVQNIGSTITTTDFDEISVSNSEYPEENDVYESVTQISREKSMLNLCNSEHNNAGEFLKHQKCDNQDNPGLVELLQKESDVEEILKKSSGGTKQNPTIGLIVKHNAKKREKKSFCCSDCGKVFLQKDCFLRHLRIHTDERPFTCHICGKGFRDSGGLTRHLRDVHARVKNFKCDICGRLFASKATCDDHRRTHTGERPFICAVCGKRFSSKASHYMHAKTHTDVFPYNCSLCERRFRRRQELLVHKRTHTGERPCACDICGREFRVSGELLRHKFVHSKDKPYCCAVCGMSFTQKRYLGKHFKKQHKDI